jgi:hypothetical protein
MVIPTLSMVHQLFDFNEEKSIENSIEDSSILDIEIMNPIQDNKEKIDDNLYEDIEMHDNSTTKLPQKKKLFNLNEYELTNNIQDVEENMYVSSVIDDDKVILNENNPEILHKEQGIFQQSTLFIYSFIFA